MNQTVPKNMDEYIAGFSPAVQEILQAIRLTIRKAAPDAQETIKYQMPTFTLQGNLIYFAAFKKHIGIYPRTTGDEAFMQAVAGYEGAKGSYRFPLDQPIPFDLIGKIVTFRVQEDLASAAAKGKRK